MPNTDDTGNLATFSVAVHFHCLITDYLAERGIKVESPAKAGHTTPTVLSDPNGRVPFTTFDELCKLAASKLDDPSLGLKLGQYIRPGHLGSHGFALMSCSNGDQLVSQSIRYSALSINAGYNDTRIEGREFIRAWRSNLPDGRNLGRIQDDMQMAIWTSLARWFYRRDDLNPNWVRFKHERPKDTSEYEKLFRCPIHFDAEETSIAVNSDLLQLPLPNANEQLKGVMQDICSSLLSELGNTLEPAWLSIARKTVLNSFKEGMPSINTVALATCMTEEELKGQLGKRGMSFRGFVDELRQGLAVGYARDPSLSLVDIAFLLGFSEQSAFQRAFKRWTNMTPGEYRRLRQN